MTIRDQIQQHIDRICREYGITQEELLHRPLIRQSALAYRDLTTSSVVTSHGMLVQYFGVNENRRSSMHDVLQRPHFTF